MRLKIPSGEVGRLLEFPKVEASIHKDLDATAPRAGAGAGSASSKPRTPLGELIEMAQRKKRREKKLKEINTLRAHQTYLAVLESDHGLMSKGTFLSLRV